MTREGKRMKDETITQNGVLLVKFFFPVMICLPGKKPFCVNAICFPMLDSEETLKGR